VPSYSWSDSITNSYSKSLSPSIEPPRGDIVSLSVKGASVSLLSTEISDVKIEPHPSYTSNDSLTFENRTERYLNREDHVFDWKIEYDVSYTIKTSWKIDYSYDYTYQWKTREKRANGNYTTVTHQDTSSGSDSETVNEIDSESFTHAETEAENLTIIYHKRPPAGSYAGISTYTDPVAREYKETNITLDGAGRFDPCCSDAADKYRETYVNLGTVESNYLLYPDKTNLPQRSVNCDVPACLHKVMAEEVLAMLDSIKKDNPTFNYSLVDPPGRSPTDLQVEAARKLILKLESSREAYVNKNQHLTPEGKMYTSSDSARYIAKNETYNKLLQDIEQKNGKLDSDLNSYILKTLKKKGIDTSALDSVTSGSMTLFNNPAIEMASSPLGKNMGIISTMNVTGQPESKYNWTENFTLLVDQKPNYLYHDPDFDLRGEYELKDPKGMTIYPLGVRNTCFFTTNISEEIADAIDSSGEYIKTETAQQISQSISTLSSEVSLLEQDLSEQNASLDITSLNNEVYNLKYVYAQEMRSQITEEVTVEVSSNPVVSSWIKKDRVHEITSSYLSNLSDDQVIQKSSTNELAAELTTAIKTEIRNSKPPVGTDELEATLNRIDTDVRVGVANGICKVTKNKGPALDAGYGRVDNELKKMANETADRYSGEVGDKISKKLDRTMAAVPCGLPVLPPHWVFTINVWTYDIVGKYQAFSVIDNDNEVIPKPYFGHMGQSYIREDFGVYDPIKTNEKGYHLKLGDNTPIYFKFSGYAATVVGPGIKGVGDKVGGNVEKSIGYQLFPF
jgi:hypothetical protein